MPHLGVTERNGPPALVLLGPVGLIRRNCAPLLVSVNEIVPQGPDKSKQRATPGLRAAVWRPPLV